MLRKALLLCLALGACAAEPPSVETAPSDLPVMKRFTGTPTRTAPRSNTELAEDFLDLAFRMESGIELENMSRFNGPITLRVVGPQPPTLQPDLQALLRRLNTEARIKITQVPASQPASITVAVVTQSQIQRIFPGAACFVVPNVSNYQELQRNRRTAPLAWATMTERKRMAIFLPGDQSPQEIRDCLHEEIAQALGPINDMYRLSDSIFNDDNMHTVLTSFDMMMLRAFYDPSMPTGLTRPQAADRIPGVLSRINPSGRGYGGSPLQDTPRRWIDSVEISVSSEIGTTRSIRSAEKALKIAQTFGWKDSRMAFSQFVMGRSLIGADNERAATTLIQAEKAYLALGNADVQAAHVSLHLAAYALASDRYDVVIDRIDRYARVISGSQNASLYAKMLMMKAEALERLGRTAEADRVRLDSLGWARYGFGSEQEIRRQLRELAGIGKRGTS